MPVQWYKNNDEMRKAIKSKAEDTEFAVIELVEQQEETEPTPPKPSKSKKKGEGDE